MIAAHEAAAKASGARLVFSCGFNSIPFDMGVWFVEREARRYAWARRRRACAGGCAAMRGGLSGGTLASGMATMAAVQRDPSIGKLLADPFALTPGFTGPAQPDGDKAYEDKVAGSWVARFMMAGINTKAVHRTNFLLGHPWGADFQYDEMLMIDGPPKEGARRPAGFDFGAGPIAEAGRGPDQGRARGRLLRPPVHRRGGGRSHRARGGQGRHGPGLRFDGQDPGRGRLGPCPGRRSPGDAGRLLDAGGGHGRSVDQAPARLGGFDLRGGILSRVRTGLPGSIAAATNVAGERRKARTWRQPMYRRQVVLAAVAALALASGAPLSPPAHRPPGTISSRFHRRAWTMSTYCLGPISAPTRK